jgi:hypothetical protein
MGGWRATEAAAITPSEIAGSVIDSNHPVGLSLNFVYPCAGNQPRVRANTWMRKNASTKLGMARPKLVPVTLDRSTRPPGRMPERMPSGMPMMTATKRPASANESDTGIRSSSSCATSGAATLL